MRRGSGIARRATGAGDGAKNVEECACAARECAQLTRSQCTRFQRAQFFCGRACGTRVRHAKLYSANRCVPRWRARWTVRVRGRRAAVAARRLIRMTSERSRSFELNSDKHLAGSRFYCTRAAHQRLLGVAWVSVATLRPSRSWPARRLCRATP